MEREHAKAVTHEEELTNETAEVESEEESELKFAGGKPPPVANGFEHANGTANLAFAEDSNEKELKEKVGKLVEKRFQGDYKKAFEHYDKNKDGAVNKSDIVNLLADAGVGNGLTRGVWASKIIEKLDSNDDREIDWAEFDSVFKGGHHAYG